MPACPPIASSTSFRLFATTLLGVASASVMAAAEPEVQVERSSRAAFVIQGPSAGGTVITEAPVIFDLSEVPPPGGMHDWSYDHAGIPGMSVSHSAFPTLLSPEFNRRSLPLLQDDLELDEDQALIVEAIIAAYEEAFETASAELREGYKGRKAAERRARQKAMSAEHLNAISSMLTDLEVATKNAEAEAGEKDVRVAAPAPRRAVDASVHRGRILKEEMHQIRADYEQMKRMLDEQAAAEAMETGEQVEPLTADEIVKLAKAFRIERANLRTQFIDDITTLLNDQQREAIDYAIAHLDRERMLVQRGFVPGESMHIESFARQTFGGVSGRPEHAEVNAAVDAWKADIVDLLRLRERTRIDGEIEKLELQTEFGTDPTPQVFSFASPDAGSMNVQMDGAHIVMLEVAVAGDASAPGAGIVMSGENMEFTDAAEGSERNEPWASIQEIDERNRDASMAVRTRSLLALDMIHEEVVTSDSSAYPATSPIPEDMTEAEFAASTFRDHGWKVVAPRAYRTTRSERMIRAIESLEDLTDEQTDAVLEIEAELHRRIRDWRNGWVPASLVPESDSPGGVVSSPFGTPELELIQFVVDAEVATKENLGRGPIEMDVMDFMMPKGLREIDRDIRAQLAGLLTEEQQSQVPRSGRRMHFGNGSSFSVVAPGG